MIMFAHSQCTSNPISELPGRFVNGETTGDNGDGGGKEDWHRPDKLQVDTNATGQIEASKCKHLRAQGTYGNAWMNPGLPGFM